MPARSAFAFVVVAPGRLSAAAQRRQIDRLAVAHDLTIAAEFTSEQTADMFVARGERPVIAGTTYTPDLPSDLGDALISPDPAEFDEVSAIRAEAAAALAEADALAAFGRTAATQMLNAKRAALRKPKARSK